MFHRHPVADERGCEPAERLRDHNQIGPAADRAGHGVRVLGQAGRVVVAWKIRRDGVMASRTQFGLHQMPVPAGIASAVDQDDCGHPAPSAAQIPIETATCRRRVGSLTVRAVADHGPEPDGWQEQSHGETWQLWARLTQMPSLD